MAGASEYLVDKHLVIVEDDQSLRDLLVHYFGVNNTVNAFEDAESCQVFLKSAPSADIFLLDYNLPKMNGINLFNQLRPLYPPSVKMILMTGFLSPEIAEEGLQRGFDSLLLKPFDFRILEQNMIDLFK